MNTWMWIWKVVFLAGTAAFAGLTIWILFAGAADIKALLKTVSRSHRR